MSTHSRVASLEQHIKQSILGQDRLVNRLLIALLADGHLLVEGAPGLAKTTAIKALASGISSDFHRIQFTPDLLPADLTGTEVFRPQDGSFHFQPGPLFHNLLLADEINRAPAKVQSALLEAMGERQITVGKESWTLPAFFMVMATQNPIENEGTYPLPEAQLDRFLLHLQLHYPDAERERDILALARRQAKQALCDQTASKESATDSFQPLTQEELFSARAEILNVFMNPDLESYLLEIILSSRQPQQLDATLARWIRFGASPRGTIALDRCARAHAWLAGRDFVTPDDILSVAHEVLRHRILLSFEAEAEGVSSDDAVDLLIQQIAIP
jgi:MoxR-like ATPase